jgi:hypothetical protein
LRNSAVSIHLDYGKLCQFRRSNGQVFLYESLRSQHVGGPRNAYNERITPRNKKAKLL